MGPPEYPDRRPSSRSLAVDPLVATSLRRFAQTSESRNGPGSNSASCDHVFPFRALLPVPGARSNIGRDVNAPSLRGNHEGRPYADPSSPADRDC